MKIIVKNIVETHITPNEIKFSYNGMPEGVIVHVYQNKASVLMMDPCTKRPGFFSSTENDWHTESTSFKECIERASDHPDSVKLCHFDSWREFAEEMVKQNWQ